MEPREDNITERALVLAEMVSRNIWGGDHGWERATDEQFKILLRKLGEALRAYTNECISPARWKNSIPGECPSSVNWDSELMDDYDMDQA